MDNKPKKQRLWTEQSGYSPHHTRLQPMQRRLHNTCKWAFSFHPLGKKGGGVRFIGWEALRMTQTVAKKHRQQQLHWSHFDSALFSHFASFKSHYFAQIRETKKCYTLYCLECFCNFKYTGTFLLLLTFQCSQAWKRWMENQKTR